MTSSFAVVCSKFQTRFQSEKLQHISATSDSTIVQLEAQLQTQKAEHDQQQQQLEATDHLLQQHIQAAHDLQTAIAGTTKSCIMRMHFMLCHKDSTLLVCHKQQSTLLVCLAEEKKACAEEDLCLQKLKTDRAQSTTLPETAKAKEAHKLTCTQVQNCRSRCASFTVFCIVCYSVCPSLK